MVEESVSDPRSPTRDRLAARLRERNVAAPLAVAGLLLVAAAARIAIDRHVVAPWIMLDELQYADAARSFADHGHYYFRDHPYALRTIYPALISPAWLAGSVHTAYTLTKAINVVLMLSASIPLYVWARRLVTPVWAVVAVVLYLLIPGFMYSAEILTENAFVPAMVLALFAIAVALERPTLVRQLLALGAVGLGIAVRLQGLVLLLILPTAILLMLVLEAIPAPGDRRRRALARLRQFWPSLGTLVLGLLAYFVYELGRGASLSSGFGVYTPIATAHYTVRGAFRWIVYSFGEVSLSVGLIPVCALIVLIGLAARRDVNASERAFAAVSAAGVFWVVVQVGTFASHFSQRVEERNMFNIVPVLLLALVIWLARGLPRPPGITAVAVLLPVGFLLTLPIETLISTQAFFTDTFGLIPLYRLSLLHTGLGDLRVIVGLGAVVAGLLFASLPRSWARWMVPIAIAAFLVVSSRAVYHQLTFISSASRHAGGLVGDPSWIDHAIGKNARAQFLYTTDIDLDQHILWNTEFWNRSLRRVYGVTSQDPSIPDVTAPLDPANGRIVPQLPADSPDVDPKYVVADTNVGVDGTRIAHGGALALYRVQAPLRISTITVGVQPDAWTDATASYTRYVVPPGAKQVVVTVSRPPLKGPPPSQVDVAVGPVAVVNGSATISRVWERRRWSVGNGMRHTFVLPLRGGAFQVELAASTFVPQQYGYADTRTLGVQVAFAVR
jgi:Dolichyl-phosphate-mannose-protein mannosyltransferase